MEKLDLRKQFKFLYTASAKKVGVVDVPALNFVMIDGAIEPGSSPGTSSLFQENIQALYGVAYTLKFKIKLRPEEPVDYPVMALEGLWWVEGGQFDISKPGNWIYTLMIMQPDCVNVEDFQEAHTQLCKKKPSPAIDRLRFERFHEGPSLQILHVGPYSTEPDTLSRMYAFAGESGYTLHGKHHEIYLGNPLRAAPEKLKTILRHPIR